MFSVIVHPVPDVVCSPQVTSTCSGNPFEIQLTSSFFPVEYSWTASGSSGDLSNYHNGYGALIQQAPQNAGPEPGIVTYLVTPLANGCFGYPVSCNVIVNPIPGLIFGQHEESICSEQNFSVSFSSTTSGTSFTWTASASSPTITGYLNGAGASINQVLENSGPAPATVTYVVTPNANGCNGNTYTVQVFVKPKPDISFFPPGQSLCYGLLAHIQISSLFPGAIYNWVSSCTSGTVTGYSPGTGDQINQILYNNGYTPETVTYGITAVLNGCTSDVSEAYVLTYPLPEVLINPPESSLCSGENTLILLNSLVAGATFQWEATGSSAITGYSGGAGNSVIQQLFNTGSSSGSVNYSVTPMIDDCMGQVASTVVTVSPKPMVSFVACHDTLTSVGAKPIILRGGFPPGGLYAGPGISTMTGVFEPVITGPGVFQLNYSYTNVYGCPSAAISRMHVLPENNFNCGNELIDIRDGSHYKTFQLPNGSCWMQANLRLGKPISFSNTQTDNCIHEKYLLPANQNPTGSLYQWDELMDYTSVEGAKGLCPPGWHVPSANEWEDLLTFFSGAGQAGGPVKDTLLLQGFHSIQDGFGYLNNHLAFTTGSHSGSMYWTSTMTGSTGAVARGLNCQNPSVSFYKTSRANAFTVRCCRD